MNTKQILRLAGVCVAVAALVWIGIGAAIWSAYRTHREAVAANAASTATTAATAASIQIAPFDRTLSSVQYEWLAPDAEADQAPDWLARELDLLPANPRSVGGWITFLRKADVQVCWKVAPPRNLGNAAYLSDLTYALPFERASVREVLDAMCRNDRRYRWEWMRGSEVVNVLADEKLEAPLGDVSFGSQRLYYCLPDLADQVRCSNFGPVDPPRSYDNLLHWPVAITAREIAVRDYLNLVVAQYDGMTWTVDPIGLLEFDAPQATRDAVAEKFRDDTSP